MTSVSIALRNGAEIDVHQTLRVTPAMEAGIADHVWSIEELVGLLETEPKEAAA